MCISNIVKIQFKYILNNIMPMRERCYLICCGCFQQNMQVGVRTASNTSQMQVAPVTGNDIGLRRAEIKQGIRQIILCKDGEGKIGLRVRHVNKVRIQINCCKHIFPHELILTKYGNVAGYSSK